MAAANGSLMTVNFDHYRILTRDDGSLHELGRGAMGVTYKAFDTNLQINVALKVINAAFLQSDVARQRFVREARAAAQLRHPNVASVLHLGRNDDAYFYSMEFVDGQTVEEAVRDTGPFASATALRIASQVSQALGAAANHHLVHRDIKPANLMLLGEEQEMLVKLIDFGLAKSSKSDGSDDFATVSVAGFVGTAQFASPEQLEERDIDARSDIYSLGVTLWYMLAGRAPFSGSIAQVMGQHLHSEIPIEALEGVPSEVQQLVRSMTEKDPAHRPQNAGELRSRLESCLHVISMRSAIAPTGHRDGESYEQGGRRRANADELISRPTRPLRLALIMGTATVLLSSGAYYFVTSRERVNSLKDPSVSHISRSPQPASVVSTAPEYRGAATANVVQRRLLEQAQNAEAARDWKQALTAYASALKAAPMDKLIQTRITSLLQKLDAVPNAEFDQLFERTQSPLQEIADLGMIPAMELLGRGLRKGGAKAATDWLAKAADLGSSRAMRELGLHYSNGAGVERNLKTAAVFFERAAKAGDAPANTLLAECYLRGKGVNADASKAVSLLKTSVAAGDPRAMDLLADCYHKGVGVAADDREAFRLSGDAAARGYTAALANLGVIYLTSSETELGGDKKARSEKAADLFQTGARGGDPYCMYLYARCLESGTGLAVDSNRAVEYYRKAAEGGEAEAQQWCRQHRVTF